MTFLVTATRQRQSGNSGYTPGLLARMVMGSPTESFMTDASDEWQRP